MEHASFTMDHLAGQTFQTSEKSGWAPIHGAWATTAAPQVRRSCFAGPVVLRPVAQHVNPALPLVDPKFPDILLVDRLSPGTWLLLECSAS